mmetsp:Transcript_4499/g.12509  ORF Transcript_4499/g.12509 Transcript_4499/m.12509 type:complete len:236 (-) Transcript_4499:629-1336(-)
MGESDVLLHGHLCGGRRIDTLGTCGERIRADRPDHLEAQEGRTNSHGGECGGRLVRDSIERIGGERRGRSALAIRTDRGWMAGGGERIPERRGRSAHREGDSFGPIHMLPRLHDDAHRAERRRRAARDRPRYRQGRGERRRQPLRRLRGHLHRLLLARVRPPSVLGPEISRGSVFALRVRHDVLRHCRFSLHRPVVLRTPLHRVRDDRIGRYVHGIPHVSYLPSAAVGRFSGRIS